MFTRDGLKAAFLAAVAMINFGCGDSSNDAATNTGGGDGAAKPAKVESNIISGRVTMGDGKPLRGDIKDVTVSIYGVSEAAEKVNYSPAVKPDGTYRQKVAGGQYAFNTGRITVLYNNTEFTFPLEPVGNLWNKNRDGEEGIVQDFVWKPTGPTPYGQSSGLNPTNATHWYGMSISLRADGWRNDTNKPPTTIPDDTKLTFTLKPTGKTIDDQTIETITVERTHASSSLQNPDINDVPIAPYELTGTATLPDGTVKPLLLQGPGDYPKYKPMLTIAPSKDGLLGGLAKPMCTFVIE